MAINFSIKFSAQIKGVFEAYDVYDSTTNVISTLPTTSITNDFIPFHALLSGKVLSNNTSKALVYSLDFHTYIDKVYKGYEDFFNLMIDNGYWGKLSKTNTIEDYRCRMGQLVHFKDRVVTPLATLVVKKEHIFKIDKLSPDYSKFFIIVSRRFSEVETHNNLYKNFNRQYLSVAKNYVDIIYTKDIESFCYKQALITPIKPKTIIESKAASKEITIDVIGEI